MFSVVFSLLFEKKTLYLFYNSVVAKVQQKKWANEVLTGKKKALKSEQKLQRATKKKKEKKKKKKEKKKNKKKKKKKEKNKNKNKNKNKKKKKKKKEKKKKNQT